MCRFRGRRTVSPDANEPEKEIRMNHRGKEMETGSRLGTREAEES